MKKYREEKRDNHITVILVSLIFVLIGIYSYFTYKSLKINVSDYETEKMLYTENEQTVENATDNSKRIADIIEESTKKIVGISRLNNPGESIFSERNESELGLGSGVIITSDGYIISNEHVSGDKHSNCYVTLSNGIKYKAIVKWSDKDLDLSILKIDARDLPYANLGDSKNIKIGEQVYAIGNPIGFEFRRTVTSGIISAKNRTIKLEEKDKKTYMTDLIQTDATINPGNSGGPLIYPTGEVIGINTVKISSADGIGFAVPINVVKPIVKKFKERGEFIQPVIGIYGYDKEVIPYLSEKDKFNQGIYITKILKGGPASKTELKEGDIITKIDGKRIGTMNNLKEYVFGKEIGDKIKLEVLNGRITKEIELILDKK